MGVFDREHYFRDLLARQVGGRTEVTLPFGRADVMTDTMVWEVEPASRYPAGVRQALQYASQTGLTAALATYGPGTLVTKVFDHLAKLPAPGVELWWLHERRFVPVRSSDEAKTLVADANGGFYPHPLPAVTCEVIEQVDDVVRSCDEQPVTRTPMRLCQAHLDQLVRQQPPIPPPAVESEDYAAPLTKGRTLKLAEEMVSAAEGLAWPHMEPGERALFSAYLIEVRSLLWHGAADEPDGPSLFGFAEFNLDPDDDED